MDVSTIFGGLLYDMKIDLRSGPLTMELFDECNAYDGDIFYPRRAYDHGNRRQHFLMTKRRRTKRPVMMATFFYRQKGGERGLR